MPVKGSDDDFVVTIDELSAIIENSEFGSFNIICGDFNAHLNSERSVKSQKPLDERGRSLTASYINIISALIIII